jgi:hypothetical protein
LRANNSAARFLKELKMFILDFIKSQKTHIIYILIIVGMAIAGSFFFFSGKAETIRTITKTNTVDRNIVKTKTQYIDRVIVKKETDGSTTTTTEHISSGGSTTDKSKSASSFSDMTKTTYLSRYSLGVNYPMPLSFTNFQPGGFNVKSLQIEGGVRLFNSPIFVTLGTNVGLDTVLVGFRVEF